MHRLQLEQDKANKQKKIEEAQAQLLILQLNKAREKHNSKKKEKLSKEMKETNKTMMIVKPQADPAPDWPDLDPNLYPDDRKPPRQRLPKGNWGTDRSQRGRGGSWRGEPRARGSGNPRTDSWNVCYQCGKEGHWARHCRELPQGPERRDYPYQARGAPRGRSVYRGGHQAPNPSKAPISQFTVADLGWEEQY